MGFNDLIGDFGTILDDLIGDFGIIPSDDLIGDFGIIPSDDLIGDLGTCVTILTWLLIGSGDKIFLSFFGSDISQSFSWLDQIQSWFHW